MTAAPIGRMACVTLGCAAAITACSQAADGDANAAVINLSAPAAAPIPANCAPATLDFTAATSLGPKEQALFADNFKTAYDKACAEGLMAREPRVDPRVYDKDTIFVLNGSEANIPSFYFAPSGAPPSMLLEWPFGAEPGSPSQIPSVEDLHEAIFCTMKGATPEEEETTGRCLPD